MLKCSTVLGALALLSIPSLAVAQEPPQEPPPPPSELPAPEAEPPPPAELSLPEAELPPPEAEVPMPPPADSEEPPPSRAQQRRWWPVAQQHIETPEVTKPNRSGATFEMSVGLGATHVSLDSGMSEQFGGLSGLNLGLGGWISPTTALTVRLAGTSFTEQVSGVEIRFIAGWLGLSLQRMVTKEAWIGGGIGIGILTTDRDDVEPETGLGFDLRWGINLYQSAENAIHLAVEITPGFYDDLNVTGFGLQLGWQSL